VSWLSNYRQSLTDGRSERVVSKARWVMFGFAMLWAVGLVAFLSSDLPGGTGTSTVILYAALLLGAYVIFCMIKLLFSPSRGSHG